MDSSWEIVYLPPRAREVFKPIEVGEVIAEPLDNMVEQVTEENIIFSMMKESIVSAYDKVVDAVICLSAGVLDFPPPLVERLVVIDPVLERVSSISTTLDPELFVNKLD